MLVNMESILISGDGDIIVVFVERKEVFLILFGCKDVLMQCL